MFTTTSIDQVSMAVNQARSRNFSFTGFDFRMVINQFWFWLTCPNCKNFSILNSDISIGKDLRFCHLFSIERMA